MSSSQDKTVFSSELIAAFDRETAKDHTLGIDKMPLGLHGLFFGEERFHGKRGRIARV